MDEVDKNGDHHQSRDQEESQIHLMVIPVQTNTSLRISTKEIYLESPQPYARSTRPPKPHLPHQRSVLERATP
jgi:hypothetical protein